uniref:Uncharacterized protein n=1 Tax=Arundo donax TaxID=35708 RepID=A0A0A9C7Q4_ARUDO
MWVMVRQAALVQLCSRRTQTSAFISSVVMTM